MVNGLNGMTHNGLNQEVQKSNVQMKLIARVVNWKYQVLKGKPLEMDNISRKRQRSMEGNVS